LPSIIIIPTLLYPYTHSSCDSTTELISLL
jgi:hypothetical protein